MEDTLSSRQELYHEIFGSILDRTEMTPYLLLRSDGYKAALKQATKMLGNRGFDTQGYDEFRESEKERARHYIEQVYKYVCRLDVPVLQGTAQDVGFPEIRQRQPVHGLPADY